MVARFNSCCTQAELQSVLTAPPSSIADAGLESHLEECAVCREALERLAAAPAWWENAQSYLSDGGLATHASTPPADDSGAAVVRHRPARRSDAEHNKLLSSLPAGLLQPTDAPDSLGRIGNYEVIEAIGRGGMGVVLKAFDPALHRFVAIKVLAAEFAHNASARRRFAREAQAAAAVVHDHVVPIYAVDGAGPNPYLVMACIPGHSLQERIEETGPLEVREILRIGMQTAAGLAAAHAQGLVHRDIKPANILLENGVERVRITDFGLARAMDEASQTQSGVLAGTPQYMAPEQASGEAIDYRADLFSLGGVLYAMCTGHSPFRAETTVAVLRRICDGAHRPVREVNPDIPVWLAAMIDKLLAKRPADRYGSAEEVARRLAEHLAEVQHPAQRAANAGRRKVAALLGALAVGVALFTVWRIASPDGIKATSANQITTKEHNQADRRTSPAVTFEKNNTTTLPIDIAAFDHELEAVRAEVRRLEMQSFAPPKDTDPDVFRQLDTTLDALENDLGIIRQRARPEAERSQIPNFQTQP
jgi:serine/threonine-protein kinase